MSGCYPVCAEAAANGRWSRSQPGLTTPGPRETKRPSAPALALAGPQVLVVLSSMPETIIRAADRDDRPQTYFRHWLALFHISTSFNPAPLPCRFRAIENAAVRCGDTCESTT